MIMKVVKMRRAIEVEANVCHIGVVKVVEEAEVGEALKLMRLKKRKRGPTMELN